MAFPDRETIVKNLVEAAKSLKAALASAPEDFLFRHRHRLERKRQEIDTALIQAASLFERAYLEESILPRGGETRLVVEYGSGATAVAITAEPVLPESCSTACEYLTPEREILAVSLAKEAALSPLLNRHGGHSAATDRPTSG